MKKLESEIIARTQSKKIIKTELIQSLWSGYGELNRVYLDTGTVILKHIKFPNSTDHPYGWSSDFSHQRKIRSYEVEFNWYQNYNKVIDHAYYPQLIYCGEIEGEKYLLLEDLKGKGFKPLKNIEWQDVTLCLKWLAHFHAHHLNTFPEDLWKVGTYWHLKTRPQELEVIDDNELKLAAPLIDQKLNSAKYKTIIHGDAKLANFLFSGNEVSAVDFQYVGGGVGVKDLAYFLSSIYDESQLNNQEELCLDYYFQQLDQASSEDLTELKKEWRKLYSYAWCDFYRFLKGWQPGHWKINFYSESMKNKVLNDLK